MPWFTEPGTPSSRNTKHRVLDTPFPIQRICSKISLPDLVPETWFTNLIPRAQFVQPWWFLETELPWNLPGTGFRNLLPENIQNLRWEVPLQLLWGKPILDFEPNCSAFHLFVFDMRTTCTVPVQRIQPCVALMFLTTWSWPSQVQSSFSLSWSQAHLFSVLLALLRFVSPTFASCFEKDTASCSPTSFFVLFSLPLLQNGIVQSKTRTASQCFAASQTF